MIKEDKINIISLLELDEKQANIAISFYLESLLSDRKNAKNQMYGEGSGFVRFKSTMIVVIEELMFLFQNRNILIQNILLQRLHERGENLV